jgi:pentatricopeptide repeat protein
MIIGYAHVCCFEEVLVLFHNMKNGKVSQIIACPMDFLSASLRVLALEL